MKRRFLLLAAALLASGVALAQAYPAKLVTLMVPYPAGGLSDTIARIVAGPFAKSIGQTVIVENVGGASGGVGAQKILAAPADGYLVYQGSPNELILAPMALASLKYKAEDFRLVQMIGAFPIAVIARKGLPASNIDELVALARKAAAEGKPLTYGSVGYGSFYHVLGEHFAQTIGANMTHVPYKGGAPMIQDMIAGEVDMAIFVVGDQILGLANQDRLKILATLAPSGKVEASFLKGYPSINDSKSVRNFAFNTWTGYFVKKDTPEPVVQALHKSLSAAMADPEVRSRLEQTGGTVPQPLSLAEAAREYEAQAARFRAIAKSIKLEAQ